MKKIISYIMIVFFLANINCVTIYRRPQYPGSLGSCKAKCFKGSVDFFRGKKGYLVVYNSGMKFFWKTYILDISFDSISHIQVEREWKRIAPAVSEPFYRYYEKWKKGPSLLETLLVLGLTIGIAAGAMLLVEFSEEYIYLAVEFSLDNQDKWVIFKAREKEFDKVWPFLKAKTGLS